MFPRIYLGLTVAGHKRLRNSFLSPRRVHKTQTDSFTVGHQFTKILMRGYSYGACEVHQFGRVPEKVAVLLIALV